MSVEEEVNKWIQEHREQPHTVVSGINPAVAGGFVLCCMCAFSMSGWSVSQETVIQCIPWWAWEGSPSFCCRYTDGSMAAQGTPHPHRLPGADSLKVCTFLCSDFVHRQGRTRSCLPDVLMTIFLY